MSIPFPINAAVTVVASNSEDTTLVIPARTIAKRKLLIVSNVGTTNVYLSLGAEAVVGADVYLKSATGTFTLTGEPEYNGPVYAISATTDAGALAIFEGLTDNPDSSSSSDSSSNSSFSTSSLSSKSQSSGSSSSSRSQSSGSSSSSSSTS